MKILSNLLSARFTLLLSCFIVLFSFFSKLEGQATITGRVFNDINNNLTFQAGEGLGNIKVWLFNLNDVAPYYRVSPPMATTTDAAGVYTFNGLGNGNYQVRVGLTTMPATITRAVVDNDSYANGLTDVTGVSGTNLYSSVNFGFAATSIAPVYSSDRNFQWNSTNTFVNQTTRTYNLAQETCGTSTYTPTITWTTDRTNAPGPGYNTDTYPQASLAGASQGQDFPGPGKGGIHPTDNTFQLMYGGLSYSPVNNDRQTTTIQFSHPVINTKFSIYDIDHADPQSFSGRIDRVKVTGYRGAAVVLPVLVNPSLTPWNMVSGNTVLGWADYPLGGYTLAYNATTGDQGTINVYFETSVDKIVIEYEEWAPIMLPGKGINNAATPNAAFDEALWSERSPTTRGISIGSIDYTSECFVSLPVQLVLFTAESRACNALLNWKTASESELNYFEIEYAPDAANFKSVGKVFSKNTSSGSNYAFTAPQTGTQAGYYRLKITGNDGKYQYSDVRLVQSNCAGVLINWNVSPNPVKKGSALLLNLSSPDNSIKKATIMCWDEYGRKYLVTSIQLHQGMNSYKLHTDKLAVGIYLIGVYDTDNNLSGELQKVIVQ